MKQHWKQIWILAAALALLAGCGNAKQEESLSAASAPNPSAWGMAPAQQESEASSQSAAEREASQVETPAPTETPEPLAASLGQVLPTGPEILAEGENLTSLSLDNTTYVNLTNLNTVYPWLSPSVGEAEATLTDRDGNPVIIPLVATDGAAAPQVPEGAGIHFLGVQEEVWLPVRTLAEKLGLTLLWDQERQTVYLSLGPRARDVASGRQVPVVMYHEVGDDTWGVRELFVSPGSLRQQLEYLRDSGYEPIFFSDLTHLEDYDKPVLLTFDDGYTGIYTELLPLLQEFQMKATVFVITGMLEWPNYLTAAQVKELSDSGLVDIQSHTVTHPELTALSQEEQDQELRQSRLDLARITGKIPYVISYPTGLHNDTTLALCGEYYAFGVQMNGGLWTTGGSYDEIPRIYVSRDTSLDSFRSMLG